MKANVGTIDRTVRVIAGAALIAAGFLAGLAAPWNYVAMGVGAVFVLTAVISFCPLYPLLGINTCARKAA
jgi:Inner membrane protein YgaP-like, transmembrane domain